MVFVKFDVFWVVTLNSLV